MICAASASVRVAGSRSWFAPLGAVAKSARLRADLERVVVPGDAVFITLTYRRGSESPADLWERASEERHVRRFVDALEKVVGRSLRGEWVRKAEFQSGGFVHWHLIVRGVRHVPHEALAGAWRHGFVWVSRCTRKRLGYFAKYFSKAETIPGFLLASRMRSVKVVAASPGFWRVKRGGSNGPAAARKPIFRPVSYVRGVGALVVTLDGMSRRYAVPVRSVPRPLLWSILRSTSFADIERRLCIARQRACAPRALHLTTDPIPPSDLREWWSDYFESVGEVA